MAIPDYQTLMLPILEMASDGETHTAPEAVDFLAAKFNLSTADVEELLPSGKQARFRNRIGWARTYMKQAGLLEYPSRGKFRITDAGLSLLAQQPERVDNSVLESFDAFLEFKGRKSEKGAEMVVVDTTEGETPEEALESAYTKLRADLEAEVLAHAKAVSPGYFEQLVVDLLVAMGYGGNRADAARAVGQSNDEGIDGVINEDALGLDVIYLQAKRWEGSVARPELQKFIGALAGKQARKGVFITTSEFTKGAAEFIDKVDPRVILIDGKKLARLMVDHNVGVATVNSFEVKRIDSDYFEE
ncbi:restriction endonuclease [gamma proteobacterium NOR5-3]|nr:restriction endonuclease [gamma proteobacterium NOR5-3]